MNERFLQKNLDTHGLTLSVFVLEAYFFIVMHACTLILFPTHLKIHHAYLHVSGWKIFTFRDKTVKQTRHFFRSQTKKKRRKSIRNVSRTYVKSISTALRSICTKIILEVYYDAVFALNFTAKLFLLHYQ